MYLHSSSPPTFTYDNNSAKKTTKTNSGYKLLLVASLSFFLTGLVLSSMRKGCVEATNFSELCIFHFHRLSSMGKGSVQATTNEVKYHFS